MGEYQWLITVFKWTPVFSILIFFSFCRKVKIITLKGFK